MMAEKVNLYDPRQLAIGAIILIVGIGGNIGFSGGFLPIPMLRVSSPMAGRDRNRRCPRYPDQPDLPGLQTPGRTRQGWLSCIPDLRNKQESYYWSAGEFRRSFFSY